MKNLSPEARAIVRASLRRIEARQSALLMSMWHHSAEDMRRDVILAEFHHAGGSQTFVQALLRAVTSVTERRWPDLRPPVGMTRDHLPLLERAFAQALASVLGRDATAAVMAAWMEATRAFLRGHFPE